MESSPNQEEFLNHGRFGEGPLSVNRDPPLRSLFDRSIFPHITSAWWIPVLLASAWIPPFILEIVSEGWVWAWMILITIPATLCAFVSVPVQAFRILMHFLNRPKRTDGMPTYRPHRILEIDS